MKKKALIAVSVIAVLLFAIYSAVLWDMASNRAPAPLPPAASAPLDPLAQVQNLQAPPPVAPAALADPNNIKALIAKLADPDPAVRAQAQLALEKIGQPALAEIQQAQRTHPDPDVRARCTELIHAIAGVPPAKPQVVDAMPIPEDKMTITERRTIIGMDGRPQIEEIVKDEAGNILRRRIIDAPAGGAGMAIAPAMPGAVAPAQQRRRAQIMIPATADPQTRAALQQAQAAQDMAWAQLDAMRAQREAREARERAAVGGNEIRQALPLGQAMPQFGRPQLGPMPAPPAAEDRSLNLLDTFGARLAEAADGVRVIEVKPDSPAGKAGLAVGDLITRVNGRQTATENDFKDAIGRADADKKLLKLDVTRRGDEITLEIPTP